MKRREDHIKLIFGLKLRQLRNVRKLSLSELSEKSGLSVSYINEIEKGKKHPKTEKIATLADVLDVPYDQLVSLKLDKHLSPIGDILNTRLLDELPFGLFGIDKRKLIEIISQAPLKVSAFISTIVQISNTYNLTQENFYFAMLRSYQEMHDNYFEEIEKDAVRFAVEYGLMEQEMISSEKLKEILLSIFGYGVKESRWTGQPELSHIRSVFIEDAKEILINADLAECQKAFLYAKELGYQYLSLSGERALMTPWPRATSFDHVLNNSRASYFAGALLIPATGAVEKLRQFFERTEWDGSALLSIMQGYNSSPEMFAIRLLNLVPRYFGLGGMFFMRFDHKKDTDDTQLMKQLHLSRTRNPKKISLLENHCRTWAEWEVFKAIGQGPKAFCRRFVTENRNKSFLVLAISRPMKRDRNASLAVAIGFEQTSAFRKKVAFSEDPSIEETVMHLDAMELEKEQRFRNIRSAMRDLIEAEKKSASVSQMTKH